MHLKFKTVFTLQSIKSNSISRWVEDNLETKFLASGGGNAALFVCLLWWYKENAIFRIFSCRCIPVKQTCDLQDLVLFFKLIPKVVKILTLQHLNFARDFNSKRLSWFVYMHSYSIYLIIGNEQVTELMIFESNYHRIEWYLKSFVCVQRRTKCFGFRVWKATRKRFFWRCLLVARPSNQPTVIERSFDLYF